MTAANRSAVRPDVGDADSRIHDDAGLAAALRAGDARAAATAWTRLSPLVASILRRYIDDIHEQEDLRQEVFLRFFARIAELRRPPALRSFLINICLGVAHNELRRKKVRRLLELSSDGELPDAVVGPADIEAREATRRLWDAIADLGASDRSLFIVRYIKKLDVEQIALVMGRPRSTAKRHLARAVRRIDSRMRRDPLLVEYVDRSPTSRAVAA